MGAIPMAELAHLGKRFVGPNRFRREDAELLDGLVSIWERSADACCVVDRICRISWSNEAMHRLLGVGDDMPTDLLLRRADPTARSALRRLIERSPRGEVARVHLLLNDDRSELEVQAAMIGPDHALLTMRCTEPESDESGEARVAELEAALADIRTRLESLGIGGVVGGDPRRQLPATLTSRQHEVAELLLAGLHEDEIAEALFISEHTVRNHKKAAFRALGVHSMAELLSSYRPSVSLSMSA